MKHTLLSAFIFILLTGCQHQSVEDVIEAGHSSSMEVTEVVDVTDFGDAKMVLYLTDQEGVNIKVSALVKKWHGWDLRSSTGFSASENELYARHSRWRVLPEEDPFNVLYGMVNRREIDSVEVETDDGYTQIPLHDTGMGRIFYAPNTAPPVRALDQEGHVLYEEDLSG
ncbi:hypothetical protein [Halobacillus litoralis]|uniref:hypothetical protein n=1 Tax=Halobacillus litoralis TaxID=45668 RepID=UPI00136CA7EE|nr:hypothetical protein [Halobacillus litoralis]MYL36911.1 hypothetical protein [Halobacillus litoralis]